MSVPERPLAVGDLAMCIHACCKQIEKGVGIPFTVTRIAAPAGSGYIVCGYCQMREYQNFVNGQDKYSWPISWVRRIPPLNELEGEQSQEKLHQPIAIPHT